MPWIVLIKCSCHSSHLCASYACKMLPSELEEILHLIYNHFSNSPGRKERLAALQEFERVEIHRILAPGQTRWLSLGACVDRVIEQLHPTPTLINYFAKEALERKCKQVERINLYLNNPLTIPYLRLMQYALKELNELNTLYQSEKPLLYCLREKVTNIIRTFARNFMHVKYVRDCSIEALDPYLTSQYLPLKQIYFGNNVFYLSSVL